MIDWTEISALQAEVGQAVYAEAQALFEAEAEGMLARLGSAPAREQQALCHGLRGDALAMGFAALGALADAAERTARGQTLGAQEVGELRRCYAASHRLLRAGPKAQDVA